MADQEKKGLSPKDQEKLKRFVEKTPPEILEILDRLDDQDSDAGIEITRKISRSFSGPLPPPELLRQYDEIVTGLADRIVAMAEKEQSHRHGTESKALDSSVAAETRGQYLAFLICALIVGGSHYCPVKSRIMS